MEVNLHFKIDWASFIVKRKFTVFALLYFVFFMSLGGAYIWRGSYMEGLIFGILRYLHKIYCCSHFGTSIEFCSTE